MKQKLKSELKVPKGYKFEDLYATDDIDFEFGPPIVEEEVNIEFGKE